MSMSVGYAGLTGGLGDGAWVRALLVGAAAVPLAPIAKDLSSRLSDALGALRIINPRT
jgi:hypothetical protein